MGQVIKFPFERRLSSRKTELPPHEGAATIVILPVVRIERHVATEEAPRFLPAGSVIVGT